MKKFTLVLAMMLSSILLQAQTGSPCPGQPTVTYEGQTYNTVQIGDRCWMKENLNIGTFINSSVDQTDNTIIEKYCYGNDESNCETYGGLYLWNEVMQYSTAPGIQGICPPGWLLPTDDEWCALTSYLDPSVDCNAIGFNGTNAGGLLKEAGTIHWYLPNSGATDGSGFTGLPGGYFTSKDRSFQNIGCSGTFHSSSTNGLNKVGNWVTILKSDDPRTSRISFIPGGGYSVRCIMDTNWVAQLTVTPTNQDVTEAAGTTSFNVTSALSWTVEESVSWLSVSPASGSNNGIVTATYEANSSPEPRVGQITITAEGGITVVNVTVTQAGGSNWTCGQEFIDARDGQTYTTVQIGNQCWMAENLNIGTRIDVNIDQTNNGTIEKYCYDNSETQCDVYGGLYQWGEMMDYTTTAGVQGICPEGWHLPTDAEWTALTTYLGGEFVAGGKMKEAGTTHWYSPNTGATNSSGFTGLPGGYSYTIYNFSNLGEYGYWWSSTEYSTTAAWYHFLGYSDAGVYRNVNTKGYGFSVRCLRD